MNNYDTLQSKIINACEESETIRAVLLVGSRARNDRPIDVQADLDYLLFTLQPAAVAAMPSWIESLGNIWIPHFGRTGPGDLEWMVIYEGGLKADFVFLKIQPDQSLEDVLPDIPYQGVLSRGFKVLLDKTGSAGSITWTPAEKDVPVHPTEEDFRTANDNFLMAAARAARLIERDDLWRAKTACDSDLKQELLKMIEWHARAENGLAHDTWYDGRYLSEWADPTITAALPATFAAYELPDLRRAFQATLALYHRIAAETAAALRLPYPTPGQAAALRWLQSSS